MRSFILGSCYPTIRVHTKIKSAAVKFRNIYLLREDKNHTETFQNIVFIFLKADCNVNERSPVKQGVCVCACVVIQRVMRQVVSQHKHTVESHPVARDNIQV